MIASPEEYPAAAIVDHEGEHAVQALEHALALTHVQVQQHFGVRVIGDETRAVPLQPAAQLRCVHDLAIEDDADLSVRAQHRLAPAGEVDDAEAAHGERDGIALVEIATRIVRTPVTLPRIHCVEQRLVTAASEADNSAHAITALGETRRRERDPASDGQRRMPDITRVSIGWPVIRPHW